MAFDYRSPTHMRTLRNCISKLLLQMYNKRRKKKHEIANDKEETKFCL